MKRKKTFLAIIGMFCLTIFLFTGFAQAAAEKGKAGAASKSISGKAGKGGKGSKGGKGGKGGPPKFGLRPAEDRKQIYDRKTVFLKLDKNNDNFLSPEEYDGTAKLFKGMDVNGDNKLSPEETKWMITFSAIPGGSFIMGGEDQSNNNDSYPKHKVIVDSFKMGTTEVTSAQFTAYLNAAMAAGEITVKWGDVGGGPTRTHGMSIPAYEVSGAPGTKYAGKKFTILSPITGVSHIRVEGHPLNIPEHPLNRNWITYVPELKRFFCNSGFLDWPAAHVTWYGAKSFANHYDLTLATEAEWEYVASGGKQFEFATSDGTAGCHRANYRCYTTDPDQFDTVKPNTPDEWIGYKLKVGSYPPNPFGVFDLAGQVWEWTLDWYHKDFYQQCVDNNIVSNPLNLVGEEPPMDGTAKGGARGGYTHDTRTKRGGAYQYHHATILTAFRHKTYAFRGNDHHGFRVALRSSSTVFNGKEF